MSRYASKEELANMDKEVFNYFNNKQKELDAIKVPDYMKIRKKDGYYKGDEPEGITSLKEMKSFWKIPKSAGKMLDSMVERAKLFVGGATGGLAGVGSAVATGVSTSGGIEEYLSKLVDFSDSDATLDKDDPSGLYYYLTKDEQDLWSKDEDWQQATQYGSMIFGAITGQPEIMMAGANQGVRETLQDAVGIRHPELLENATKRRNADLLKQAEIKQFKEKSAQAIEDLKDDYAMADLSSDLYVKKIAPVMDDIAVRSSGHAYNIPVITQLPSSSNIPVDFSRGRGLNERLIPHNVLWERKAFGRKHIPHYKKPLVMY
jgi:hypothetical protein